MKAFPLSSPRDLSRPADNKVNPLERGMDLRDYFAARAMQGIVEGEFHDGASSFVAVGIAQDAYTIADAMMKVRDPNWVEDFGKYDTPKKEAADDIPAETVSDEKPEPMEIKEAPAKPAKKVSKKND